MLPFEKLNIIFTAVFASSGQTVRILHCDVCSVIFYKRIYSELHRCGLCLFIVWLTDGTSIAEVKNLIKICDSDKNLCKNVSILGQFSFFLLSFTGLR